MRLHEVKDMPTLDVVEAQIGRFCVIYGKNLEEDELSLMIEEWFQACEGMSDEAFLAACEETKKTARFFPIPQQVIAAHDMRQRRSVAEQKNIEVSEDQRERNRIYSQVMRLRMSERVTKQECDPVFDRSVIGTPASLRAGVNILKRFGIEVAV